MFNAKRRKQIAIRTVSFGIVVLAGAVSLGGSVPAFASDDADCAAVRAARNPYNAPFRATSTTSGTSTTGEIIFIGNTMYLRAGDQWMTTVYTPQEMKDLLKPTYDPNQKHTCKYLRDEAVNGELAAVYSVHNESPTGTVDETTWISRSTKLTLRDDMDTVSFDRHNAKSHMSMVYDYRNVQKPKM